MSILHIVSMFCFALCFLMFFYLKWYIKKRTASSGTEEHRGELFKLIVDINNVTERNLQLIEDGVARLKVLLHDVDKRIALYEKDLEELSQRESNLKNSGSEALYTSLGRGIRDALSTPPVQSSPSQPALSLPESAGNFALEAEPEPAAPEKEAVHKPPLKKQIRAHIDILLNEGLPPEEIASRLEISIAEVNLAMNLRRNK